MGHRLVLGMIWSANCEACKRTKPVVNKVLSLFPNVHFLPMKVKSTQVKIYLLNKMGISVEEDESLDPFQKAEYLSKGIDKMSAMPTFFLKDMRRPNVVLEVISGGVGKPPDLEERTRFESLLIGMLTKYTEISEHKSLIKPDIIETEVSDTLW